MPENPSLLVISSYRESINTVRPEGRWFVGLARDHGYRITVMTERREATYLEEMEAAGVRIIDWQPSSKWKRADSLRIARELTENHYDLLFLLNNVSIYSGIRAAKGWVGKVVTYRGYTGNIHWWDPTAYLNHLSPRVDMISCVSAAVAESLPGLPFLDPKKLAVVGKGHDPAWYADVAPLDLEQAFDIPPHRKVIVMVANARRMKGTKYLGAAIQQLPPGLDLHFLFVGRGLRTPEFESLLTDSQYAHEFTFAGYRTDVLEIVAAADISLLPSVKGEGLSKVLLESMFLGRPTIMTDIGGNRGLGIDRETALIIPARDDAALKTAIQEMAENGDLRARLGPAGRAFVTEHFRATKTARDLDIAFRNLLASD
ncbi:glycosyltransferase family 4 protein [Neolewinella antarctica]|uniref:Glycosyltransferase involved in cell wall biosynthesis n=1 Tax=Neolewinella antarctica TaxID=442734 RepID=A0ABX0X7K8_9BACT|nr:glycosyltransferase family 4 protein [Neolewinella antarctica]NJC24981.1 glycosyltransferase involved in cell wall biosynthesis [Neolewinella antarctica]